MRKLKVDFCASVRMHQLSILLAQMCPLQDSFSITRKLGTPHKRWKDWAGACNKTLYLWCEGYHVKELHFVDVETFALTTELKWLKATKSGPRDLIIYSVRFRKDIEWQMHTSNLVRSWEKVSIREECDIEVFIQKPLIIKRLLKISNEKCAQYKVFKKITFFKEYFSSIIVQEF